jgi:putative methionine-R-sulfoxide reductase with GAF domain
MKASITCTPSSSNRGSKQAGEAAEQTQAAQAQEVAEEVEHLARSGAHPTDCCNPSMSRRRSW